MKALKMNYNGEVYYAAIENAMISCLVCVQRQGDGYVKEIHLQGVSADGNTNHSWLKSTEIQGSIVLEVVDIESSDISKSLTVESSCSVKSDEEEMREFYALQHDLMERGILQKDGRN